MHNLRTDFKNDQFFKTHVRNEAERLAVAATELVIACLLFALVIGAIGFLAG